METIDIGTEWVPDRSAQHCSKCERAFGFTRWRHHCRMCGHLVCAECQLEVVTTSVEMIFETPWSDELLNLQSSPSDVNAVNNNNDECNAPPPASRLVTSRRGGISLRSSVSTNSTASPRMTAISATGEGTQTQPLIEDHAMLQCTSVISDDQHLKVCQDCIACPRGLRPYVLVKIFPPKSTSAARKHQEQVDDEGEEEQEDEEQGDQHTFNIDSNEAAVLKTCGSSRHSAYRQTQQFPPPYTPTTYWPSCSRKSSVTLSFETVQYERSRYEALNRNRYILHLYPLPVDTGGSPRSSLSMTMPTTTATMSISPTLATPVYHHQAGYRCFIDDTLCRSIISLIGPPRRSMIMCMSPSVALQIFIAHPLLPYLPNVHSRFGWDRPKGRLVGGGSFGLVRRVCINRGQTFAAIKEQTKIKPHRVVVDPSASQLVAPNAPTQRSQQAAAAAGHHHRDPTYHHQHQHSSLTRSVSVPTIRTVTIRDALNEISLLASVQHRHVAAFHSAFQTPNSIALVYTFGEGGTLSQAVCTLSRFILMQVCNPRAEDGGGGGGGGGGSSSAANKDPGSTFTAASGSSFDADGTSNMFRSRRLYEVSDGGSSRGRGIGKSVGSSSSSLGEKSPLLPTLDHWRRFWQMLKVLKHGNPTDAAVGPPVAAPTGAAAPPSPPPTTTTRTTTTANPLSMSSTAPALGCPAAMEHLMDAMEGFTALVCCQIVAGLTHLVDHARIVHRDLKGDNVVFTRPLEHCHIIDLGFAERAPTKPGPRVAVDDKGREGYVYPARGTSYYLSPLLVRQLEAGRQGDVWATLEEYHQADLYSLGIMLYQLIYVVHPSWIVASLWQEEKSSVASIVGSSWSIEGLLSSSSNASKPLPESVLKQLARGVGVCEVCCMHLPQTIDLFNPTKEEQDAFVKKGTGMKRSRVWEVMKANGYTLQGGGWTQRRRKYQQLEEEDPLATLIMKLLCGNMTRETARGLTAPGTWVHDRAEKFKSTVLGSQAWFQYLSHLRHEQAPIQR